MSLFLRNKGTEHYKLEEENIVSKFITRGTNTENVREHRAILEGNKDPPGRPSQLAGLTVYHFVKIV